MRLSQRGLGTEIVALGVSSGSGSIVVDACAGAALGYFGPRKRKVWRGFGGGAVVAGAGILGLILVGVYVLVDRSRK